MSQCEKTDETTKHWSRVVASPKNKASRLARPCHLRRTLPPSRPVAMLQTFHGFRTGEVYRQVVVFRNVTHLGRRLRVELPAFKGLSISSLAFSSAGPRDCRSVPNKSEAGGTVGPEEVISAEPTGVIAPGMSAQVRSLYNSIAVSRAGGGEGARQAHAAA